MKTNKFSCFIFSFFIIHLSLTTASAQVDYFFSGKKLNSAIPSPEQFLGYQIGTHQTRHDQLVAYMKELDRLSDRVSVQTIGMTNELRPQIIVLVTSPTNFSKLPLIQQDRFNLCNPAKPLPDLTKMPVVVQLGANVHGNETSGGESLILAAYYLAASEDEDIKKLLDDEIVLIEPVLNPDGRDRFVSWVNQHKGSPNVTDPNDREHNEVWPGGRTNHYWFDLNRDWYLGVQVESQNRLKFYHQWRPNVVTDQHEMGTNSTFFFEPSKENAENPLVPQYVYKTLNGKFAKYYEAAMNQIGSLYYTKESFDNLYPGYGSSYPDMQGGVGILFEQGSSRGFTQESQNGLVTFAHTVRNQYVCAMATLKGALDERQNLLKFQREFYSSGLADGSKSNVKGYVVSDGNDATKLKEFTKTLLRHQIECYQLTDNLTIDGQNFEKGKAIFVPTGQPQYRLVQSVFERPTKFADSLFYDASTWNLALSFGLNHSEVKTPITKGSAIGDDDLMIKSAAPVQSNYAYLLSSTDFNATKALYQLLSQKILIKAALKNFKIGDKSFPHGSLLIAVQSQDMGSGNLFEVIKSVGQATGVNFVGVSTGFSQAGVDLGSNNFQKVQKPEVLLIVGQGTNAYEAGEVWYLTEKHVGMPVTKVELAAINRTNLSRYNTIVMVSGQYPTDKILATKLKSWVATGGTLITMKTASEWAIKNDLVKEKLRSNTKTDSMAMAKRGRINFEDAAAIEGAKGTGGAAFEADLDTTHPLGWGYLNRKIALYRNNNTILETSTTPFSTVVSYSNKPLLTGYVHPQTLQKIAGSAGVLVNTDGAGRVILFADNPNFRGVWYGTSKLFLNALFFGNQITAPFSGFGEEK
jgi:Zinc carboxypeptidase